MEHRANLDMSDTRHIANRVTRLESHLLDKELVGTFDGLVDQLELPTYSEELKLIAKLYLFASYVGSNATAGMKVYNMNYCDTKSLGHPDLMDSVPRQKLVMLTALNLVGSYVAKRNQIFDKLLHGSFLKGLNLPWLNLDTTSLVYKAINVVNFLIFLKAGTYLTLPERILGIAPVVTDEDEFNNAQLHRVQTDYMYRETIWRATSEFLTTIIPLINIDQVKNRISKLTGMMPRLETQMKLSEKIQQESKATRCAICLKQPFNPYIIGCRHVFCYYCLQVKHQADRSIGYVCLQCKFSASDTSLVQRFKFTKQYLK